MATSEFTAHYHLDKYAATDKPNLRDQYNAAMDKVDDALYTANTNATDAKATANAASQAVSGKASQADLNALSQTVADKASQADLSALSALLPSGQFSSQNTVKAYVDAMETRLKAKKKLVVIGDSYSASAQTGTPLWHTIYAAQKNLDVYTNASDGVGFITGANNFNVQLDNAISTLDPDDVSEVIIMGGLNDFGNGNVTPAGFADAVRSRANKAITAFPKALVTVALLPPFQYYGFYDDNIVNKDRYISMLQTAQWALMQSYAKVVDLSQLGLFTPDFFGPANAYNQRHPSANGSKIIANVLLGGSAYTSTGLSANNCPLLAWLLNAGKTNCNITNIFPHSKPNGTVTLDINLDVTDRTANAVIDVSRLPYIAYTPIFDSAGNSRCAYVTNNDNDLVVLPFGAQGGMFFTIDIPQI